MTRDNDVVIVSAVRTPIGKFQGCLAAFPAPKLGAIVIRAAVDRVGIQPTTIDEVLMGNVVLAGQGQAPARQASIAAGIPPTVGATTINKICGSGLKTVMLGAAMIRASDANIVVAGGMESMDNGPYLLPKARFGYRLGHGELIDATVYDGLWCSFEGKHMGSAAEWIAREYGITRQAMDEYALESHRRAIAATDSGAFANEIVPVEIPQRKKAPALLAEDEAPRRDTSLEKLAKLKPAFEEGGRVTAGNAPGITDGAAAVVIMSRAKSRQLGIAPLARIVGYAQAAVKPAEIFTAPIFAVRNLLDRTGLKLGDIDLIELNEAFAAQTLADGKVLELEWDRVNVNGGAIALGHPIGASGARVLVTLIYALRARELSTGVAALCLGGGEAVAMAIEVE
jgi:acetyl-CoA C-acetyltransferase